MKWGKIFVLFLCLIAPARSARGMCNYEANLSYYLSFFIPTVFFFGTGIYYYFFYDKPEEKCDPRTIFSLNHLPNDMLKQLFQYLNPTEQKRLRTLCKKSSEVLPKIKIETNFEILRLPTRYVLHAIEGWFENYIYYRSGAFFIITDLSRENSYPFIVPNLQAQYLIPSTTGIYTASYRTCEDDWNIHCVNPKERCFSSFRIGNCRPLQIFKKNCLTYIQTLKKIIVVDFENQKNVDEFEIQSNCIYGAFSTGPYMFAFHKRANTLSIIDPKSDFEIIETHTAPMGCMNIYQSDETLWFCLEEGEKRGLDVIEYL